MRYEKSVGKSSVLYYNHKHLFRQFPVNWPTDQIPAPVCQLFPYYFLWMEWYEMRTKCSVMKNVGGMKFYKIREREDSGKSFSLRSFLLEVSLQSEMNPSPRQNKSTLCGRNRRKLKRNLNSSSKKPQNAQFVLYVTLRGWDELKSDLWCRQSDSRGRNVCCPVSLPSNQKLHRHETVIDIQHYTGCYGLYEAGLSANFIAWQICMLRAG